MRDSVAANGELPLLISDVNMPQMDGFMLAEALRATPDLREAVIIMLTSGGRQGDLERCAELKVNAHLMKPVKHSELLETIMLAVGPQVSGGAKQSVAVAEIEETLPALNILLAEDGKANQILAVGLLSKWGHQVTVVENGVEAVEKWQLGTYDLILMDVQMPLMDGLEATQKIRELEVGTQDHIPIVAMTARAMKGDREKCLESGMDDYVSKPARKSELYRAISGLVSKQASTSILPASGPPASSPPASSPPTSSPPASGPPASSPPASSPPAFGQTDVPVFDWDAALETVDGHRQLLRDVLDAALQEMPRLKRELAEAIEDQDANTARRLAHTIKGGAAAVGALRTRKVAADIEQLAGSEELDEAARLMPQLNVAIDEMLAECKHFDPNA